jgi:hypothetical protein
VQRSVTVRAVLGKVAARLFLILGGISAVLGVSQPYGFFPVGFIVLLSASLLACLVEIVARRRHRHPQSEVVSAEAARRRELRRRVGLIQGEVRDIRTRIEGFRKEGRYWDPTYEEAFEPKSFLALGDALAGESLTTRAYKKCDVLRRKMGELTALVSKRWSDDVCSDPGASELVLGFGNESVLWVPEARSDDGLDDLANAAYRADKELNRVLRRLDHQYARRSAMFAAAIGVSVLVAFLVISVLLRQASKGAPTVLGPGVGQMEGGDMVRASLTGAAGSSFRDPITAPVGARVFVGMQIFNGGPDDLTNVHVVALLPTAASGDVAVTMTASASNAHPSIQTDTASIHETDGRRVCLRYVPESTRLRVAGGGDLGDLRDGIVRSGVSIGNVGVGLANARVVYFQVRLESNASGSC